MTSLSTGKCSRDWGKTALLRSPAGGGSGGWASPGQQPAPTDPTPPAPEDPAFNDVSPNAWYADYVASVATAGLFQGTAPGIFSPQGTMTRAMFAQVFANLEDADTSGFTVSRFNDVLATAWYLRAVEWAAHTEIVQGVGGGNFAPNAPITREQMAVILYRYAMIMDISLPQYNESAFTDQDSISPWAVDAVRAIQSAGIVTGRPDGRFDPRATATRAEVAAIFARFLELLN